MNHVAVQQTSSYRDPSPSKLPRYQPVGMNGKQMNKQPSRLQMLQADYQDRLMKEKEEKMIRMYEDQQQRALGKVNQRNAYSPPKPIGVREFFQERRVLEQKGYQSPPIEEHYKRLRRGNSIGGRSSASSHVSSVSNASRYNKNSAGKDRSNLLQPLEKTTPPLPTKPRMARQKPHNSYVQSLNSANSNQNPGQYEVHQNNSRTSSNGSSPPPNLQTLRNFQKKRLSAPARKDSNDGSQKLTDFQRWQMEQNKAREQRLEKHHQSAGGESSHGSQWGSDGGLWGEGDSSDGDKENKDIQDELARKQRELMEEIERQQAELEEMKLVKQREEDEARKAAELERKREADRERRRQQQAQAERRRQEEAEERERREAEEERKRRAYEERKRQQQQQQQQRRAARPPPRTPTPETEPYFVPESNVDFYANAAMEGEGQSVNMKLAPCKVCGRKFASDRLAKHQSACKTANKPRKVFDPIKMRTEGTEMAKYVGKPNAPKKEPKKKDWRAQHESFIETIRYAKKVSEMEAAGIKPKDLPPPPKTNNPDYVKCPKCNRSFNPDTAKKHIPNCRAKPRK